MADQDQNEIENFILPSVQLPLRQTYTYASPIPKALLDSREPCKLGVDEAGRGPCLGPMVYGICYYPESRHEEFKQLGFDDSKKLTEEKRVNLAKVIQENLDWIGWAVQVIAPQEISTNMLRRPPFNLNEMAHATTMQLVQQVLTSGVNVTEIFVDPVGPSQSYKTKLSRFFPGIEVLVEPHADALYPSVSAASICAKVTRDQILQNWVWLEPNLEGKVSKNFGSGYPSDPNTVKWLDENEDPFFGYPSLIRFSWKTISNRMARSQIEWSEDEDEENEATNNKHKRKVTSKVQVEEKKPVLDHHHQGRVYKSLCLESVRTL